LDQFGFVGAGRESASASSFSLLGFGSVTFCDYGDRLALLFAVPSFLSSNFINSDSVAAVRGGDYSVSVVELLFIDELFSLPLPLLFR
jgi:hypothetical protein